MRAIQTAIAGNQGEAARFVGMITEAVSPVEFMAPENVARIMQGAA